MRVTIVSGFFNPLHGGHLDMIEEASKLGDRLVVIVNNDKQQLIKKGKVILDEQNRLRLINALGIVDEAFIAVDEDPPVIETLKLVRKHYPNEELLFANGGDRDSVRAIPETEVCEKLDIELKFGVGGMKKADSSTRINQAVGNEE